MTFSKLDTVPDNITLQTGDQRYEIPLIDFVAGWAAVCNDSLSDEYDDSVDAAWRGQSLPLAAWPHGRTGPIVIESVEMLCRILCDTMDWTLKDDAAFCVRNAKFLHVDISGAVTLRDAAIQKWEAADRQTRNKLLRQLDGRVFAVLVASGNSLD